MRKLNWSTIVLDLIYMALGVVFIIRPEGVESVLCYILAAAVAVIGLLYLCGYIIQKKDDRGQRQGNGFAFGILLIIMAVFIVAKQNLVISLVPFLFGVMVLIRGLMFIQNIFILRRAGLGIWPPLGAGLVTMAIGLFVMLFPFETATMLFVLIGIGLLVGGLIGIAGEVLMWSAARRAAHEEERARDMAGARTVTEVEVYDPDLTEAGVAEAAQAEPGQPEADHAAAGQAEPDSAKAGPAREDQPLQDRNSLL